MTTVAAGILTQNGKILICRRGTDRPHALKWEFPGGKVETGESPEAALVRELSEELAIAATAGHELMRYEFAYPGKNPILLVFIAVRDWRGEIENRIFDSIAWAEKHELAGYDFLEGDERFLRDFIGSGPAGPEKARSRKECSSPDSEFSSDPGRLS